MTTLDDAERIARRVLGGSYPLTTWIEDDLRNARAALRARETPVSPSLADAVSQFGKAVSDGKFRAAVPDSEPDEGAVNPWLADQISKSAASREHRA